MDIEQVYKLFPTQEACIKHLEIVMWRGEPTCPYCKSKKFTPTIKEKRLHCNTCNTSYSVTVNSVFHNTKIDLQKWFLAVWLVLNTEKSISARQIARDIEVNKNTGWLMLARIKKALIEDRTLLTSVVKFEKD